MFNVINCPECSKVLSAKLSKCSCGWQRPLNKTDPIRYPAKIQTSGTPVRFLVERGAKICKEIKNQMPELDWMVGVPNQFVELKKIVRADKPGLSDNEVLDEVEKLVGINQPMNNKLPKVINFPEIKEDTHVNTHLKRFQDTKAQF